MIILGFFLHIKIKHWLINKLSVNWKGQGHVSRHELNNNNCTVNLAFDFFFFEGGGLLQHFSALELSCCFGYCWGRGNKSNRKS